MKVIAAIPSRGVLVTEAIASVLEELTHVPSDIPVFSWNLPIPDAHNAVVEKALTDKKCTHVWLVEEDVIVPPGTLRKLLDANAPYVCADLPEKSEKRRSYVARWPVNDPMSEIYWSHVGCTLIKREVFEKIPRPWFENHYKYEIDTSLPHTLSFQRLEKAHDYGGHDMIFCKKLLDAGYTLKDIPVVATHCRVHWNSGTGNDGRHRIEKFETIGRPSAIHSPNEEFLLTGVPIKEEDQVRRPVPNV